MRDNDGMEKNGKIGPGGREKTAKTSHGENG